MALERKIQDLLGRRNELADRLANLESMKKETNQRVYSRIKADYDNQLNEVLNSLGAEKGSLEDKVSDLTARINELEQKHQSESDLVEELQIRAKLREHDENDPKFQKELDDATGARNKTADELDGYRSELGDMKKVLRDVEDATAGKAAAMAAQPAAEAADSLDELELDEEVALEEETDDDSVPCPSCGHVNPPQKLFCEECGAALDEEEGLEDDFDLLDDGDLDL
jgi:DNA repair exonuclease SbcCD ATPase subunit